MISKGELKIINILKKEGIDFFREYHLDDPKVKNYRYDFYLINENILIEFDGEQHLVNTKRFYKDRQEFLMSQERDRKKNAAALSSKIPLFRVPFFDIDKINCLGDILIEKYRVRSIYHNDKISIPKNKTK